MRRNIELCDGPGHAYWPTKTKCWFWSIRRKNAFGVTHSSLVSKKVWMLMSTALQVVSWELSQHGCVKTWVMSSGIKVHQSSILGIGLQSGQPTGQRSGYDEKSEGALIFGILLWKYGLYGFIAFGRFPHHQIIEVMVIHTLGTQTQAATACCLLNEHASAIARGYCPPTSSSESIATTIETWRT